MEQKPQGPVKRAKKPNQIFRVLALAVTAALVLGALALVVYRDRFNLDALRRWLSYRTLQTDELGEAEPFTHAGGNKLSLAYLDSGILLSSASGAHYYSFSGEQYAEELLGLEDPVLSASGRAGVVYDVGGQSLFLFRDGEERLALELDGNADLLSARVNESGWLAVTAQQSGYKGVVTVYDQSGKAVEGIKLSSTFAVDAALSPDCETVAVVTMDHSGGAFASRVSFYPVGQEEPASFADLGGMAVLDLDFEEDRLWVLGEDRLTIVPTDGGEVRSYFFGRSYLKACELGGDGFALLLLGRYRAGSADQALSIGPDGTVTAVLGLSGQTLDCAAAGGYCSLLTGSRLTVYTPDLKQYAALSSTQGAKYTALSPNGSSLLASDQQAWLFIPG